MREFLPIPDPSGSLQPPRRYPPTAVGVETPEPEPRLRTRFARIWASEPSLLADVLRFIFVAPARVASRAWKRLRRRVRS
ncbi:MAG TPA: hypothetical protein VHG28_05710 [Longimicrobiaceae bacterium]|nr:hypothetical protein [Longimicrobiaceae bacterium]